MLKNPSHGVLFGFPEQGAMVYAHVAGAPAEDSFSVAVTQPNGEASVNHVLVDGDMRQVFYFDALPRYHSGRTGRRFRERYSGS